MANQNTVAGFPSGLFAQSITTANETALTVPVSGVFAGLPSPTLAAGSGLWIGASPDIQGGELDGHPFRVRVAGKIFTGAASTFLTKLYNVPAAVAAAGTAGTLANNGTAVIANAASAAITGAANFILDAQFIWDSLSLLMSSLVIVDSVAGVAQTPTYTSKATTYTAGTPVSLLNFIPSFTFGTANAANTVTVTEFVIDRV